MANIYLTGIVLSAANVGEHDRSLYILTKEHGKISAFARGSRRTNSPLLATTVPMCFGTFEAYPGRNAYYVTGANISHYFRDLTTDYDSMCYGALFLEMAEYMSVEEMVEKDRLGLLFMTLRALQEKKQSFELIRAIYELRSLVISGEYPDVFSCKACRTKDNIKFFSLKDRGVYCEKCGQTYSGAPIDPSTLYAMQFIMSTPVEKLYTFALSKEIEAELIHFLAEYKKSYFSHRFKAEDFLQ